MLLLSAAAADDTRLIGLQTLIASGSPAAARGRNVAITRTMAASRRAVRCLGGDDYDGGEEEEEEEEEGGDEVEGGCWVSYGWRRRLRRLPPPIPSLRPLARERTADGRLVISREEAAHRVCARKSEDRLVLELVGERDGGTAQRRRRWSHPLIGQDASASTPAADGGEAARAPATSPAAVVPAEACLEGTIRAASLRGMRMNLPSMVH